MDDHGPGACSLRAAPYARRTCLVQPHGIKPMPPSQRYHAIIPLHVSQPTILHHQALAISNTRRVDVRAQGKTDPEAAQRKKDNATILGTTFSLTAAVLLAVRFGGTALQDLDSWDGIGGLTSGDFFGAAFWSVALYFASPWQLLLLFLGKIETERPSDWVLKVMGRAAKLDVNAIDYVAPLPLRIATIAFFCVSGVATAAALDAGLGDGTWAVSSGIGALFGAGLYEVGRPERLSVDEAQILEKQWQDFAGFANDALIPRGRCHESEIFKAFRARFGKYRTQDALSDVRLRDMVRNWNRSVERSNTGFYKNISLKSAQPTEQRPATAFLTTPITTDEVAGLEQSEN